MKAQSLSICIPTNQCNKNCPFCISKMTGFGEINAELMERNAMKVKHLAKTAGVNSVIITSKGKPTLEMAKTVSWIQMFKDYLVELQTNGIILREHSQPLMQLMAAGLNVIAVSISAREDFQRMDVVFNNAKAVGLITRATVAVTNQFYNWSLMDFVHKAQEHHIDQLSFRKLTAPTFGMDSSAQAIATAEFVKNMTDSKIYDDIMESLEKYVKSKQAFVIRELPYGSQVVDLDGIAVVGFKYCIQDTNNNEDIRSLIFQADGHLYLNWNSKASVIL